MTQDILAIVGSVKFACPDGPVIAVQIINAELLARRPDAITSGCAEGVDQAGEQAADLRSIEFIGYPPKRRQWHGPGGFKERNQRIADTCTRALRIVCAESKTYGSGWTVDRAAEQGKPVRRVVIHTDGTVTDSGWPGVTNTHTTETETAR